MMKNNKIEKMILIYKFRKIKMKKANQMKLMKTISMKLYKKWFQDPYYKKQWQNNHHIQKFILCPLKSENIMLPYLKYWNKTLS